MAKENPSAMGSQRAQNGDRHSELPAAPRMSVSGLWKLALGTLVALSLAGCGTKTELLKPDGKPTAHDERDPSQPPSPISR